MTPSGATNTFSEVILTTSISKDDMFVLVTVSSAVLWYWSWYHCKKISSLSARRGREMIRDKTRGQTFRFRVFRRASNRFVASNEIMRQSAVGSFPPKQASGTKGVYTAFSLLSLSTMTIVVKIRTKSLMILLDSKWYGCCVLIFGHPSVTWWFGLVLVEDAILPL